MLFEIPLVLLVASLLGLAGVYNVGGRLHGLLLIGLMAPLLPFLTARDAAVRRAACGPPDRP